MIRKRLSIGKKFLIPLISVILLTGCDVSTEVFNDSEQYTETSGTVSSDDTSGVISGGTVTYTGTNTTDSSSSSGSSSEADLIKSTGMIKKSADITIATDNIYLLDSDLYINTYKYEGYFEESKIKDYENEYSTSRWGYYTIRIPQESLNNFINDLSEDAEITQKTIKVEDVSLNYIDIEAKIAALEQEKENLERLESKADSVSDILSIEKTLASVQSSIDSYTGQKLSLEGKVTYSTVNISAKETRTVDNVFFKKLGKGFENAGDVFINIIVAIPTIFIIAVFTIIFLWIIRKIWKKIFKNRERIHYVLTPVTYEKTKKSGDRHTSVKKKNEKCVVKSPDEMLDDIMESPQKSDAEAEIKENRMENVDIEEIKVTDNSEKTK